MAVSSSIHETNAVKTTFLFSSTPLPEMVQEKRADIPTMPRDELVAAQREDQTITRVLNLCELEVAPPFEINRRSQVSYNSSYANRINCPFTTSRELEIDW